MKDFKYIITDEVGLHARPAGMLVKKAKTLPAKVMLFSNGKGAEATKLMAVMALGIKKGMEVTVTIEGEDEEQGAKEMEDFFREYL